MPSYKRRRRPARRPLTTTQYKAVTKIANKQIHKLSELKTKDSGISGYPVTLPTAATAFATVPLPVQGITDSQRIGDSIYLKNVMLRGVLQNESDVDLSMRVIVVQTGDNYGGTLTLGDVLQDPVGSPGVYQALNSPYLTNPVKRFRILHDSIHHWDSNPNSVGTRSLNLNFSGKQLMIHKPDFDVPANETCTGQIYYLAFSNVALKGSYAGLYSRVRYFDN